MVDAENTIPNSDEGAIHTEKIGEDRWHLELRIPESSWSSDEAGPPAQICFHYADPSPGEEGERFVETWPPVPGPLLERLALSIFDPRYLAYFE